MTLPDWPALRGAAPPPWGLRCEHAIWGKVQGGAAEYRWLARTPSFGAGIGDPTRTLRVGTEDSPVRVPGWRALPERFLAVAYYPSRAQDAAGRGESLERQVLEWRPDPTVPPALAALALLPAAAGLDDLLWWDRRHLGHWGDPGYTLPLEALELGDLGPEWLAAACEGGIAELAGRLGREGLRDIYAQILAGLRPARLTLPDGPLGPLALAALLLPLPAQTATRLSLVGWVPAEAPDPADLAGNWDLVVTQPGLAWLRVARDRADLERAERMAAALLGRDPGPLAATPEALAMAPKARHPRADPLLAALAQFAADPNRRLLDMAELARALAQAPYPMEMPDGPHAHPLCMWVERTTAERPDWADGRSWGLKVDQLRAAALVLLPHPETLGLVGLPESPWVPALLPALACRPARIGPALGDHGKEGLRRILRQSLACPRPRVQARIRVWVDRWRDVVGADTSLGALAAECLAELPGQGGVAPPEALALGGGEPGRVVRK